MDNYVGCNSSCNNYNIGWHRFSSSSCLFGFGRFRCALVFLILIFGLFGSQPPFAKPKFGSHSLVGMCLVFATLWLATLYCPYGPLVIETMLPHLPKVSSSKWEPQVGKPKGILPHFLCVCHVGPKCGLPKVWLEPNTHLSWSNMPNLRCGNLWQS